MPISGSQPHTACSQGPAHFGKGHALTPTPRLGPHLDGVNGNWQPPTNELRFSFPFGSRWTRARSPFFWPSAVSMNSPYLPDHVVSRVNPIERIVTAVPLTSTSTRSCHLPPSGFRNDDNLTASRHANRSYAPDRSADARLFSSSRRVARSAPTRQESMRVRYWINRAVVALSTIIAST
jgi:hypothetical protein